MLEEQEDLQCLSSLQGSQWKYEIEEHNPGNSFLTWEKGYGQDENATEEADHAGK